MKRACCLLVLLGLILLVVQPIEASAPRDETRRYSQFAAQGDDCPPDARRMMDGSACFSVEPGESWVHVVIEEESVARHVEGRIAVLVEFPGWPAQTFCDEAELGIPSGASTMRVTVQWGHRADFCGEGAAFSHGFYGHVRASFT